MGKSNIITQTTSLLKETNKLTSKLGLTQISLRKGQTSDKSNGPTDEKQVLIPDKSDQGVINSVDSAKSWLSSLESNSKSAWVPVIKQQITILESVESPSMSGMKILIRS